MLVCLISGVVCLEMQFTDVVNVGIHQLEANSVFAWIAQELFLRNSVVYHGLTMKSGNTELLKSNPFTATRNVLLLCNSHLHHKTNAKCDKPYPL